MKKKPLVFSILSLILILVYSCTGGSPITLEERQILEIAKDTAIKVYGYDKIAKELPLVAELKNDSVWVVKGTFKDGSKGGTVYVEILRKNQHVRKVLHYK